MPEGDTIYRAAVALRMALAGRTMTRFEATRLLGPQPQPGRVIELVESHGKHLEIAWDDGIVLHTHMRMSGAWHLYRTGEQWRRSATQVRVTIGVAEWVAVCFAAPVVETYRYEDRRRHPGMGSLGPDLCKPLDESDLAECLRRMADYEDPATPIHEVMLDQRIACGVGNVFKSEVLHACAVNPFLALYDVGEEQRQQLIETASALLQANLQRAGRITIPDAPGGLAVYGRTGYPCFVCGTTIEMSRQGTHARSTYWCPRCQPDRSDRSGPAADAVAGTAALTSSRWPRARPSSTPSGRATMPPPGRPRWRRG